MKRGIKINTIYLLVILLLVAPFYKAFAIGSEADGRLVYANRASNLNSVGSVNKFTALNNLKAFNTKEQITAASTSSTVPMPFKPTDAIMHPTKPIIYFTDIAHKRVYSINYETGVKTYIQLDLAPERLVYSNNEVYVTLLISGHNYYSTLPERGAVAIINCDTFTKVNQFNVDIDPYDIAVDKNGVIYLTSGSNQWTCIKSYSRKTGMMINSNSIRQLCPIEYNETLNKLYTITTDSSPRDISAYIIDNAGNFTGYHDSPYHGDYSMDTNFKISPDGKYIFNGSGNIFASSNEWTVDMKYLISLKKNFSDVSFNLAGNKFFLGMPTAGIEVYAYDSFNKIGTFTTVGNPYSMFYQNGKVIALTNNSDNTINRIEVFGEGSMIPYSDPASSGIRMFGNVLDVAYDRTRNKAYAIDNALNNLYVLNLGKNTVEKTIKLPYRPDGICVSEDYTKVYIVNNDTGVLLTEVDLSTENIRNVAYTTEQNCRDFAHKRVYNRRGKLFILTAEGAPKLIMFDAATLTNINYHPLLDEIGGLAVTKDGKTMYTWRQYGWDAGSISSWIDKYNIDGDTLTKLDEGFAFGRDPLNTPIFLMEEDKQLVCKDYLFDTTNLDNNVQFVPEPIYAMNDTYMVIAGKNAIYNMADYTYASFGIDGGLDVKFFNKNGLLYFMYDNVLYNIKPISGDTNGDGVINIKDLASEAIDFNTKKGNDNFDFVKDINNDNVVDIFDLVTIAKRLS